MLLHSKVTEHNLPQLLQLPAFGDEQLAEASLVPYTSGSCSLAKLSTVGSKHDTIVDKLDIAILQMSLRIFIKQTGRFLVALAQN